MIRFGDCVLDPPARELRRAGEPVHLEPQAFDLLVHLVEHRDQVVSKIDLLDGVWGHRFVSEAALTTRIKEIRRAVGDDGTAQHTIRNVRGRGYRFVAEVGPPDGVGTHRTHLPHLIGRDSECETLRDLLHGGALVTLLGPGGVGKSTLARAVLADRDGRHPHGAHLVELAADASSGNPQPAHERASRRRGSVGA